EQREFGLKRAEAAVRERYSDFGPQVAAVASARTQSINETAIREDEIITTVGVNVALNLFSGGRRIARVLEAKHARREAEYRITETELKIVGEVRQALLDLQTAQQVLILQRGAAEFVEKNRDLVVKEYDAGRAMLVRLNQAQRDLVQAQGQLAQARVALQRSWAALRAATGVNLTELNEAPENESTME
ncbi:MAG TPA: TolC family protein, partial [Candidatus Hydrogenedentes bacterium]|nr:TolC family protein [Candidatus Hydrogenedentota bacterium]